MAERHGTSLAIVTFLKICLDGQPSMNTVLHATSFDLIGALKASSSAIF
jgi:hypothetical protein